MSATTTDTDACIHCGSTYRVHDAIEGNYCSRSCYYRAKGRGLLNQLDTHSRICSTCYGRVKSTNPPVSDVDCSAGFQFPTERTVDGVDDFSDTQFIRIEATRMSCICGTVDPSDMHAVIQRQRPIEVRTNLYNALVFLSREGAIDTKPNQGRFTDALNAYWHDGSYVAGYTCYGPGE